MAESSAPVTIAVAVIGVIGIIIPIYVTNVIIPDYNYPQVSLQTNPVNDSEGRIRQFETIIENDGNAPATNLSMLLDASPMNILNATNRLSTTDVILPDYNRTLELNGNQTINRSLIEVEVPKLIHGTGSVVKLLTFIDTSNASGEAIQVFRTPDVYAVYDQGSIQLQGGLLNVQELFNENLEKFQAYYIIFYVGLFGLLYLYIRRRRSMKRFLTEVAKNIMDTRAVLRNDPTTMSILSDRGQVWFRTEKKRQNIKYVGDYLLIDDFHSELRRRNLYLEGHTFDKNKVIEFNKRCLDLAEKTLKDIDWNKFR